MQKLAIASLSLVLATSAILPSPQRRAKDRAPADFKATLESAQKAWDEGRWGACMAQLETATGVARARRSEAIIAAFPTAPDGWSVVAKKNNQQNNALASMFGGALGSNVEHEYKKDGGDGSVKVTLTFDSPMVQMFNMMLANPAMMGDDKELIEYDNDRAVLEKKSRGKQMSLQILIGGKHVCQVDTRGIDDDMLFKIFDQDAVNKISRAISE